MRLSKAIPITFLEYSLQAAVKPCQRHGRRALQKRGLHVAPTLSKLLHNAGGVPAVLMAVLQGIQCCHVII
jgi:hypothetical protein